MDNRFEISDVGRHGLVDDRVTALSTIFPNGPQQRRRSRSAFSVLAPEKSQKLVDFLSGRQMLGKEVRRVDLSPDLPYCNCFRSDLLLEPQRMCLQVTQFA